MRFDTNTHFEPLHRNSIRKMFMEWWKVHGKWQDFLMQFFLLISHGCLHYTDATLWSNTDSIRISNSERCVCAFLFVCILHSNLSYSNGKTTSTHFEWTHFDVKAIYSSQIENNTYKASWMFYLKCVQKSLRNKLEMMITLHQLEWSNWNHDLFAASAYRSFFLLNFNVSFWFDCFFYATKHKSYV